jgi:hypothetical protein
MTANYLTQEAADARYVQSPGSFATSGNITTVTPGDTASAGVLETYARGDHQHAAARGFKICTSATRPASPTKGDLIFETDTGDLLTYYGATTGWRPPWNQPWGYITHATVTANQAGITTVTDIAGLTIDVPQVLNRRYRYTVNGEIFSTVADGAFIFALTGTDNAQIKRDTGFPETTSSSLEITFIETAGSTATVTRKLRLVRASGTGSYTFGAGSDNPALILCEDIGPSGDAPAA